MVRFLVIIGLITTSLTGYTQHTNRYCNSAFTFCLDVPGNFNRIGKSQAGDGQFFTSKDGSTLNIFGAFNTENETVQQRLSREQATLSSDTTISNFTQIPTIGQAQIQENSYTFSYQNQTFTYLIFRKLEDNNWLSIELKFPAKKSKDYEEKMQQMIKSFN